MTISCWICPKHHGNSSLMCLYCSYSIIVMRGHVTVIKECHDWERKLERIDQQVLVRTSGSDNGSSLDKIRISDHDVAVWPDRPDLLPFQVSKLLFTIVVTN